jgi:hypothetical protein
MNKRFLIQIISYEQVAIDHWAMLQVGDRVLKIGADEVGRVCRVEGTKVVVERAAGGRRFHLQSATNFYRLDDAAAPPGRGDAPMLLGHASGLLPAACMRPRARRWAAGACARSAELASVCAAARACARQN